MKKIIPTCLILFLVPFISVGHGSKVELVPNLCLIKNNTDSLIRNDVVFYNADSSAKKNKKSRKFLKKALPAIGIGIVVLGAAFIEKNILLARGLFFTGLATTGVGVGVLFRKERVEDAEEVNLFLKKSKKEVFKLFKNPPIDSTIFNDYSILRFKISYFAGNGSYFLDEEYRKRNLRIPKRSEASVGVTIQLPTVKFYEIYFDKNEKVFFARFKFKSNLDEGWRESKRITN